MEGVELFLIEARIDIGFDPSQIIRPTVSVLSFSNTSSLLKKKSTYSYCQYTNNAIYLLRVCANVFVLLYCCVQTLYAPLNIPMLTSVVRRPEVFKIDATSQIPAYSEISTLYMRISLLLVDDLIIVSNHTIESKRSVFMFSIYSTLH
jgi:hypothetical protein